MSKGTILVIDDESDLVELVRYNLEKEGFEVIAAGDGVSGLDIARRHRPDLAVLDLMLPGLDGLDVCRQLRADERTRRLPVIMLTAKATEADRVVGLELGADDYLVKPFSPRELVARVRAVLRRTAQQRQGPDVIRCGALQIDSSAHEVRVGERAIALTPTEFRILHLLASRRGRVLSRDDIVEALGRDTAIYDRTIDVHVTALRRKLGEESEMIETVRGFGYKLRHGDRGEGGQ